VNAKPSDGRHARRVRTEARLCECVGELLREGGPAAITVAAVAARADADKVLIYRYFEGLEGLMAAYAAGSDFWPTLDEILGPDRALLAAPDHAHVAAQVLSNYAAALRRRPVTLDLLAWECAHRNALTEAMETVRERRSTELFAALAEAGFPLGGALPAVSALFAAAINYLAMRGRQIEVFAGLPAQTDDDWQRIVSAIEAAFRAMMASGR
jgi:AcrR family transcriptional regulator